MDFICPSTGSWGFAWDVLTGLDAKGCGVGMERGGGLYVLRQGTALPIPATASAALETPFLVREENCNFFYCKIKTACSEPQRQLDPILVHLPRKVQSCYRCAESLLPAEEKSSKIDTHLPNGNIQRPRLKPGVAQSLC